MISIQRSRFRSSDRIETQTDKRPSAVSKAYTAPIQGWVSNTNLAGQSDASAVVLDNFWPTQTGIKPRGGAVKRTYVPSSVERLFEYKSGNSRTFFAATETAIYPFGTDTAVTDVLAASVTGQTSGDYSTTQMQTDGGSFLSIVNGQDYLQIFDGTSWQQVTGSSTPFAITGLDTRHIAHLWTYRNRQFFIERDSMSAWYLGVNSVAGAATHLPLFGLFGKGGSLLFGATWSSDSGSGLDDRCVFVTSEGQCAVFNGDPIDGWALAGVYDIGRPLGRHAHMTIGGDLIVATVDGLIPLSAAVSKDAGALKLTSLSRAIEPDWHREVLQNVQSLDWKLVKWNTQGLAFVVPPKDFSNGGAVFAVNLETGAWTRCVGWKVCDLNVLGDRLYYGDDAGSIFQANTGGTDDGSLIECKMCLAFDHLGSPGGFKAAHLVRGSFRHSKPFNSKFSIARDYHYSFPAAPDAATPLETTQAQWDVALWDEEQWAVNSLDYKTSQRLASVSGQGNTLAVQLQITSSGTSKLDCELVFVLLTYSNGGIVT